MQSQHLGSCSIQEQLKETPENTEDVKPKKRLFDVKPAAESTFADSVPQRELFDVRTAGKISDIFKDVTLGRSLFDTRTVGNTSETFRDNASESPLFSTRTIGNASETLRNVITGSRVVDSNKAVGNTFEGPRGDPEKRLFDMRTIGRNTEEPGNSCAVSDSIDDCQGIGRNGLRDHVALEFSHAYSPRKNSFLCHRSFYSRVQRDPSCGLSSANQVMDLKMM